MTNERYEQIVYEVKRRVDLWLDNSSFEEMTVQYSRMRFHMAIGLGGYPFEKESWMNKNDFNAFVTDDEFHHPLCDHIVDQFFNLLMNHKDELA